MKLNRSMSVCMSVLLAVGTSRADFQYTQRTQVTGGALVGMTKTLGVFSKNARQINEPQTSTHMLKGNRLRTEHSTGDIQIIDLDGKRFIHIDSVKKTYMITTFEQFRQQMEQAKARAKEEQAKQAAKHPDAQNANVKMTPHFDAQATGATKTVAGLPTSELKVKLEMEMQSDDPATQAKMQGNSVSMWVTSDQWMAESVPGYDQMHAFYAKMAKELDWLPGEMGSMMGTANVQMGSAMEEFRKHAVTIKGMPMLTYTSMGMGPMDAAAAQAAGAQTQPPAQQPQTDSSTPTNPKDALMKGLGGMFKKKQQQQPAPDSSATGPAPAGPSNSMMDTTTEVTSYSNEALDATLFDIPAGYTQVQPDPNHPMAP
jgi:hypothetical protein